jgi:addiction module RelE/StbE family toxin
MLNIVYSEKFISQFELLNSKVQTITEKKIDLFKENHKHPSLKTHKLKGVLDGYFSFSIDHSIRIIFEYDKNNTVNFLKIGNHDIYR